MTMGGATAEATAEQVLTGLLWERRLLAAMWLVWAGWVCLLSMHSLDAALSQAARTLPEEVVVEAVLGAAVPLEPAPA